MMDVVRLDDEVGWTIDDRWCHLEGEDEFQLKSARLSYWQLKCWLKLI